MTLFVVLDCIPWFETKVRLPKVPFNLFVISVCFSITRIVIGLFQRIPYRVDLNFHDSRNLPELEFIISPVGFLDPSGRFQF